MNIILLILTFMVTAIAVTFLGYWVHRWFHHHTSYRFYDAHMHHHIEHYPPLDFWSEKYRGAGLNSTVIPFILAFSPLVLVAAWLTFSGILSMPVGIVLLATTALTGLAHDYIHDQFHLTGSWLVKFDWFKQLRTRHHIHHLDMHANYGILVFWWDRLFGTFDSQKLI